MQDDIFGLLMIILMLQCGNSTENINQIIIMFLLSQSQSGRIPSSSCGNRDDGFTF